MVITQALELVNLYLTGRYSQAVLADLLGKNKNTVKAVLSFRSPYNELSSLLTRKQLERLAYIKRINRGGIGNAEKARAIRRMLQAGYSQAATARAHSVSEAAVSRIRHRHTWGWLRD